MKKVNPPIKKAKSSKKKSTRVDQIIVDVQKVLDLEACALIALSSQVDEKFASAVKKILACRGKLVFCGMGKAGIVAQKVAGTFSSLGHPSFFMHAAEAGHGDLGMISRNDMVFLFSNSGNTSEITSIIPFIKEIGTFTVGITGNRKSYLYRNVDIPLWMGDHEEACGLGLAPTTSTTLMLALGDALAVSVHKQDSQFTEKKFAFNHPGGSLGKKLLRVKDAMRSGDEIVVVSGKTTLKKVIVSMTQARIGSAIIIDKGGVVRGIFSDGDLRRVLEKTSQVEKDGGVDFFSGNVEKVMTLNPKMVDENDYVMDAMEIMSQKKIGEIPVVKKGKLSGVVCLKDLV